MCGLFSIMPCGEQSPEMISRLRLLFMFLGILNDTRGGHSWGMWSRDGGVKRGLLKIGSQGAAHLAEYTSNWMPLSGGWICGHTRFATVGERTAENSHPYVFPDLTLAHNGVVTVTGIEGNRHSVDSGQIGQILEQTIAKMPGDPFQEQFKEAIRNVTGSCGLLITRPNGELWAYESSQDLHIAYAHWGYAISSDDAHLKAALELAGLEYHSIKPIGDGKLIAPWYGIADFEAPAQKRETYYGSYCGGSYWKNHQYFRNYPSDDLDDTNDYGSARRLLPESSTDESDTPARDTGTASDDEETLTIVDGDILDNQSAAALLDEEVDHKTTCDLCCSPVGNDGDYIRDLVNGCVWYCCKSCRDIINTENETVTSPDYSEV